MGVHCSAQVKAELSNSDCEIRSRDFIVLKTTSYQHSLVAPMSHGSQFEREINKIESSPKTGYSQNRKYEYRSSLVTSIPSLHDLGA